MIEFRRLGAPGGFPVLVHHGLVGSADAAPEVVAAARAHGLELICLARPGYGESTPVSMPDIASWAALVQPLLTELGIARYGVWAISAGAPYAYALAALDPARTAAVAVTSGLGHLADPRVVALYGPESRAAFEYFRTADPEDVRRYWFRALDGDSPALRAARANEGAGPGREAVLQQRPWGFDLGTIGCPVALWHSAGDGMVPYATAEWTAALIPGAVLHPCRGDAHIPTPEIVSAAFAFLAAAGSPAPPAQIERAVDRTQAAHHIAHPPAERPGRGADGERDRTAESGCCDHRAPPRAASESLCRPV